MLTIEGAMFAVKTDTKQSLTAFKTKIITNFNLSKRLLLFL